MNGNSETIYIAEGDIPLWALVLVGVLAIGALVLWWRSGRRGQG